ncbi:MAG: M23 family metallopeptidase [Candidatus Dormiibacterota bacterium]
MIRAILALTAVVGIGLCGGTGVATGAVAGSASGVAFVKPLAHSWISQGFGCTSFRLEPVDLACPERHWHSGIDLAAARGTPVMATLPGVATVILSATGYGLHVVIDHGGGLSSLYGHLDTVTIASGEYVSGGAVIGTVGSSGNASGPHLHFEIRRDNIPEDPRLDLALP